MKELETHDTDIRDYAEGMPVTIGKESGRWVIEATNEGGFNGTAVDLLDVIKHYEENKDRYME